MLHRGLVSQTAGVWGYRSSEYVCTSTNTARRITYLVGPAEDRSGS